MAVLLEEECTQDHVAHDNAANAYMGESEGDQDSESIFYPLPKVPLLVVLQITHLTVSYHSNPFCTDSQRTWIVFFCTDNKKNGRS